MRSSTLRRCGPCTACCTALGVRDLGKPMGTCCEHQSRHGYRRYAERPASCRAFECLWLQGIGSSNDRPDRTGVVFSAGEAAALGQVVQIHEVTEGAWDRSARAQRLGEALARQYLVVRVRPLVRTIVGGPDALVRRATELAAGDRT